MSTLLKGSDYLKSTLYETLRCSGLCPRGMGIRGTYRLFWVAAYAGRGARVMCVSVRLFCESGISCISGNGRVAPDPGLYRIGI